MPETLTDLAAGDPLVLWGARTGNCLRAAIGLAEAGIPYTVRHIELRSLEQRAPEHLARNPRGKLPVLTGEALGQRLNLTQSNAILLFADQAAPGRILPRADNPDRLVAIDRFFFFLTEVIAVSGAGSVLQQQRLLAGAKELAERSIEAAKFAESFAAEGPYLAGSAFSLADIAGFTIITSLADRLPWAELPALNAWRQRIAERPGVQEGWRAFDTPA